MKTNIKIMLSLAMAALMTSCIKEVEFTGEQTEPVLVVNGMQQVGKTPNLIIEKSHFFLSNATSTNVEGLEVKLFVNDEFVENLTVADSMLYAEGEYYYETNYKFNYCHGDYIFKEGDKVRFEITSDEFDPASASLVMPGQPEVLGFDTTRMEGIYYDTYEECPECYTDTDSEGKPCRIENNGYYDSETHEWIDHFDTIYPGSLFYATLYFALQINDAAGSHYYNIKPTEGFYNYYTRFYSEDPVFSNLSLTSLTDSDYQGNDSYNVFSDALFENQHYDLNFYSEYVYFDNQARQFTVELSLISEDFYKYFQSYRSYNSNDLGIFTYLYAEPTQIYSNVEGGIGIVGAMGKPVTAQLSISYHR